MAAYYEDGKVMQRGFYLSNGSRLGIEEYGDTWEHYDEEGNLECFCETWKTIQKSWCTSRAGMRETHGLYWFGVKDTGHFPGQQYVV